MSEKSWKKEDKEIRRKTKKRIKDGKGNMFVKRQEGKNEQNGESEPIIINKI